MSQDDLAARLDAVERRLDAAYPQGPADGDEMIERIEAFADRLTDLEAAVEAVEGYVGEVERLDDELEQRADAALAAADGVEERLDAIEERVATVERGHGGGAAVSSIAADERSAVDDIPRDGTVERNPAGSRGEPPNESPEATGVAPADHSPAGPDCTCDRPGARSSRSDPVATQDQTLESTAADAASDARQPSDDAASSPRTSTDVRAKTSPAPGGQPPRTGPDGAGPTRDEQPTRQGRQRRPVGTDGGRTNDRRTGDASVSGWGESTADPGEQRRRDGRSDDAHDGRGWGDSSTETLLDRLRSML